MELTNNNVLSISSLFTIYKQLFDLIPLNGDEWCYLSIYSIPYVLKYFLFQISSSIIGNHQQEFLQLLENITNYLSTRDLSFLTKSSPFHNVKS